MPPPALPSRIVDRYAMALLAVLRRSCAGYELQFSPLSCNS